MYGAAPASDADAISVSGVAVSFRSALLASYPFSFFGRRWLSACYPLIPLPFLLLTSNPKAHPAMPPRLLRPKDEPGAPDDYDVGADLRSNKRRAVSSACIPCRKRKSKVCLRIAVILNR